MASKKAVTLVVTLAVTALLAAFLAPVAINQLEADASDTIRQDVGVTEEVNAELNTTLDSVDGTADSATYTLQSEGQSITKTVDNGTTATYSFENGDVNVTVNDVNTGSPGNAEATYAYDKDFAYSEGASSMWGLLGLAIVLALVLYLVGKGMSVDGI